MQKDQAILEVMKWIVDKPLFIATFHILFFNKYVVNMLNIICKDTKISRLKRIISFCTHIFIWNHCWFTYFSESSCIYDDNIIIFAVTYIWVITENAELKYMFVFSLYVFCAWYRFWNISNLGARRPNYRAVAFLT